MKKAYITLLAAICGVMIFTGCKPTEAGYKAAYEAAREKRLNEQDDAALYGGMKREGEPDWRRVGNDSVQFVQQPLAPLDGDGQPLKNVNVAVASYKMNTNAKAHAERLLQAGYNSCVLKTRTASFLVIAGQFDTLEQAVPFIEEYVRTHPDDMYAGLFGRPIVTSPSGLSVR